MTQKRGGERQRKSKKMKTEVDQATLSDETNRTNTDSPPRARRIAYKAVLAAVVIVIVTLLALWVFAILQKKNPVVVALTIEPDNQVEAESEVKGVQVFRRENRYDPVERQGPAGRTQTTSIPS